MAKTRAKATSKKPQAAFAHKLVLNQWLLSLFNVKLFEDLAEHLRNEDLEGMDENNIHHFHHALTAQLFNLTQLATELLLEYDQNIVKHTQRLNERRITRGDEPIVWKYFQYLTLLFSEIYLDRYFRDPKALLGDLNKQVAACNEGKPQADRIAAFDEATEAWPQLNKLAFWMGHRHRQDAADARQHPAVPARTDPAWPAARVEPHPPAYAQPRALAAAPA